MRLGWLVQALICAAVMPLVHLAFVFGRSWFIGRAIDPHALRGEMLDWALKGFFFGLILWIVRKNHAKPLDKRLAASE